jgi:hypothetical protein
MRINEIDLNKAKVQKVTRQRADDSIEVRYHVKDSDGVTVKVFDDLAVAKKYLSDHRFELNKD